MRQYPNDIKPDPPQIIEEAPPLRTRTTLSTRPVSTYFSAIRSPRTPRKYVERINALEKRNEIRTSMLTNKPDLLCHNYIKNQQRDSPILETNHLYANLEEIKNEKPISKYALRSAETIENETAILEELTRAADQILQAVNGYTDEESLQISTEDEHYFEPKSANILSTISETNSLKTNKTRSTRTSVKTRTTEDKTVKKTAELTKVQTRRLQRASSREALFQSHGSSSEDIATPPAVIPRKPRSTRRTKMVQNGESGSQTQNHTTSSSAKKKTTTNLSVTEPKSNNLLAIKKEK